MPVAITPGRMIACIAIAMPIAAHFALGAGYGRSVVLAEAVLAAIALASASLRARRSPLASIAWIAVGIVLIALAATGRLPIYVPPIAINLLLAWLFGHTLLPTREPLLSRVARLEHGAALDPATARYTRSITIVWCMFFVSCAAVSLILAWFASEHAWSWFANVLNLPLAVALFIGEYLYRRRRFRDREHASPLANISRFAIASATLFESRGARSR